MEHDERSADPDAQAADMEEGSHRLAREIEDVESDWESKKRDSTVPGAQPEPGEDEQQGTDDVATDEPDASQHPPE